MLKASVEIYQLAVVVIGNIMPREHILSNTFAILELILTLYVLLDT